MTDFYDIMFEVSNEERVRIMRALSEEQTSFSGLARSLDITTQEVSRHFNRLINAGLTTRDNEGYPCLTAYGRVLLRQLDAPLFIVENEEYFTSHRGDLLPVEFLGRIGELRGMRYMDDVMLAIHSTLRILREAEEYVLDINLPYISSGFPHIKEAYDRGVEAKFLKGYDLEVPEEMQGMRRKYISEEFMRDVARRGQLEQRLLETNIILYMNEREVALFCLPSNGGKHDFRGFTSADPVAHKWCRDLFYYYWTQGGPLGMP